MRVNWNDVQTVVTGGASFIGSHLVEKLVELGGRVTVADDFSSGRRENLRSCKDRIEIHEVNLREYSEARSVIREPSYSTWPPSMVDALSLIRILSNVGQILL
jgi:UDP-glucose 4-epimerase